MPLFFNIMVSSSVIFLTLNINFVISKVVIYKANKL
jgi:hypothetical protein